MPGNAFLPSEYRGATKKAFPGETRCGSDKRSDQGILPAHVDIDLLEFVAPDAPEIGVVQGGCRQLISDTHQIPRTGISSLA